MPKKTEQKLELITIDEVTRRLAENMTGGDIDKIRQEVVLQIFDGRKMPSKPVFTLKFLEPHFAFLDRYPSGGKIPEIRYSICLRTMNVLDKEAARLAGALKSPEAACRFIKPRQMFEVETIKLKPLKEEGDKKTPRSRRTRNLYPRDNARWVPASPRHDGKKYKAPLISSRERLLDSSVHCRADSYSTTPLHPKQHRASNHLKNPHNHVLNQRKSNHVLQYHHVE